MLPGHHQMPAEEQRSGGPALWCARRPDRPLKKVVSGIETGHQMPGRSWRAGKASRRWKARRPCPPLEKWAGGGFNKSSSDDRPSPGICDSKYVEDAKASQSVMVWDMKERGGMPEGVTEGIIRCRAGAGGQGKPLRRWKARRP